MKILITGGTGMLGKAFETAETKDELVLVGSSHWDLTRFEDTLNMFKTIRPQAGFKSIQTYTKASVARGLCYFVCIMKKSTARGFDFLVTTVSILY